MLEFTPNHVSLFGTTIYDGPAAWFPSFTRWMRTAERNSRGGLDRELSGPFPRVIRAKTKPAAAAAGRIFRFKQIADLTAEAAVAA
jgi:hypothetical protein